MGHACESTKSLLPSSRHLEERLTVSQSVSQAGRQAVSQPISQSDRQAVSQAVGWASRQAKRKAETHSLAFFSRGLNLQTVGNPKYTRAIGGRVLEHLLVAAYGVSSDPGRRLPGRVERPISNFHLTLVQTLLSRNFWTTHPIPP